MKNIMIIIAALLFGVLFGVVYPKVKNFVLIKTGAIRVVTPKELNGMFEKAVDRVREKCEKDGKWSAFDSRVRDEFNAIKRSLRWEEGDIVNLHGEG